MLHLNGLNEARKFYREGDWTLAAVMYKHAAQMAEVEEQELDIADREYHRRACIRANMETFPEQVFELLDRDHPPVLTVYATCPFCNTGYGSMFEERPVGCSVCEGAANLAKAATDAVQETMENLYTLPRTPETLEKVRGWVDKLGDMLFRVDFSYFCEELEDELGGD